MPVTGSQYSEPNMNAVCEWQTRTQVNPASHPRAHLLAALAFDGTPWGPEQIIIVIPFRHYSKQCCVLYADALVILVYSSPSVSYGR